MNREAGSGCRPRPHELSNWVTIIPAMLRKTLTVIAEFTFVPASPGTPWPLIVIIGLFGSGLIFLAVLLLRRKR